jgi:hypothetical protein
MHGAVSPLWYIFMALCLIKRYGHVILHPAVTLFSLERIHTISALVIQYEITYFSKSFIKVTNSMGKGNGHSISILKILARKKI